MTDFIAMKVEIETDSMKSFNRQENICSTSRIIIYELRLTERTTIPPHL